MPCTRKPVTSAAACERSSTCSWPRFKTALRGTVIKSRPRQAVPSDASPCITISGQGVACVPRPEQRIREPASAVATDHVNSARPSGQNDGSGVEPSIVKTHGVPLNTVRDLLGHSSVGMSLRYADLAPDQRREAVAKLNEKPVLALSMRLKWEGVSAAGCYSTTKMASRPQEHFGLRL